ncbi:hypothetical protein SLEP1_g55999 [Rubroshorea leprosula]|uniref:Reverse transcriptase Ty1/copia-type domain-containing protein n=1 Tax=Rubroshorea leprosula TaxID=152421 RepID=A0AAV5MH25_9ROSI|nr:hypothetical protein SLEP1_g55999 [Rubroshorea leprosula]
MAVSHNHESQSTYRFNQQSQNKSGQPFYHCDYCGLDGHSESRCHKKLGNPNYQTTSVKCDFKDSGSCFQRNSTEQHTASSRSQLVVAAVDHGEKSSDVSSPFTQDQIQQLLSLIQPSVSTSSNPLVNMADLWKEHDGLYYLAPSTAPFISLTTISKPVVDLLHFQLDTSTLAPATTNSSPVVPLTETSTTLPSLESPTSPHVSEPPPIVLPELRCSSRHKQVPTRYKDYHYFNVHDQSTSSSSSTPYPISNYLSYARFSPAHYSFLNTIACDIEPSSSTQAIHCPEWRTAMQTELQALEDTQTWSLVPLPPDKKPIGCKWVYKIKRKSDGSIERFKAQLVAKGYTQVEGIDYHDTFAPVIRIVIVHVLLAIVAVKQWPLHQMDVQNAFLHGDLQEEPLGTGFPSFLVLACGFQQSPTDYSLFRLDQGSSTVFILLYIDDMILTGNNPNLIARVMEFLFSQFKIKDLDSLKYFLGIEVARSHRGIYLSQRKYTLDLLDDSGPLGSKTTDMPMETNLKLIATDGPLLDNPSQYRRLVGHFIYLTVTKLDICFTSKKQNTIALSSAEAEYRAMAFTTKEAAQHIVANLVFHERTKHLEIDCHLVREKFQADIVCPLPISSSHQPTDIFTKALGKDSFYLLRDKLSIHDLHAPA